MNFFQQLDEQPQIDLVLRIYKKDGDITIGVLPGSNQSSTKPINITGSAADLDAEFFEAIIPKVKQIKGIISNLDSVKKELEDDELSEKKSDFKKAKTPSAKKQLAKKEEPKAIGPALFEDEND
jgi:PRTRC genetic system protein E